MKDENIVIARISDCVYITNKCSVICISVNINANTVNGSRVSKRYLLDKLNKIWGNREHQIYKG